MVVVVMVTKRAHTSWHVSHYCAICRFYYFFFCIHSFFIESDPEDCFSVFNCLDKEEIGHFREVLHLIHTHHTTENIL